MFWLDFKWQQQQQQQKEQRQQKPWMPNAKPGQVTVAIAVAVTVAVAVTIDVEVQLKVELELGPRLFGVRTECGLPQKIRERETWDPRPETGDSRTQIAAACGIKSPDKSTSRTAVALTY